MGNFVDTWNEAGRLRQEKEERALGSNGAAGPAIVPPQHPPPPPPGTGAQAAQPGPQAGVNPHAAALEEVLNVFREWLLLDSDIPVLAMLGTIAANVLPGDPVWLGLIAPPSSAKTEMLVALRKVPHVEMTDGTMTPAGLLSGTPRRSRTLGATGGLLNKIGRFGFLVAKDFGAVLSMRPDNRNEMLQVFRDIYDGRWSRTLGSDGGRKLVWEGKLGLLFGCTREFDSHYSVISELGDRFLLCRMEPNKDQFRFAMKQIGKGAMMRARMADAVAKLFTIPLQPPRLLDQAEIDGLDEIIQLAVTLRAPVKRDNRNRELESALGVEGTGRFGKALERLLAGLDSIGIDRSLALNVVNTVAFDSVPPNRLKVYEKLKELFPTWITRANMSEAIRLPASTTRRVLEELVLYQLAEIDMRQGQQGYLYRAC